MKKGKIILSGIIGFLSGVLLTGYIQETVVKSKEKKIDKFRAYYNVLNQWLSLKQEGKSLTEYFIKHNYNNIAIYGMGELGNKLYNELKNTSIKVAYAIDQNADSTYAEIDIYNLEKNLPQVDVIIVTSVFAYDEIQEKLSQITDDTIESLEDILYEI